MNNNDNKLVSVEDNLNNNFVSENDIGAETDNDIYNKVVSGNDDGVDKDPQKTK